jgi:hypothetical protein
VARADWLDVPVNRAHLAAIGTAALQAAAAFVHQREASCEAIAAEFGLSLAGECEGIGGGVGGG